MKSLGRSMCGMLLMTLGVSIAQARVITTAGDALRVDAVNAPRTGLVDIRAHRVTDGIELSGTWMQTGSSRMHYRNRVRVEVQDARGALISSETVRFQPKIRSHGLRDKVWVMRTRLAGAPAPDATVKLVFLARES